MGLRGKTLIAQIGVGVRGDHPRHPTLPKRDRAREHVSLRGAEVEVRAGSDGDRFAGAEGRAFRVLPKRVSIAPLMLTVMGLLVHSEHRRTPEGPRNRASSASK
jgi:hypothetical protein